MDRIPQHILAIGAALVLAFITESYPTIGGAILILVVLSMLQTAARKGMI